MSSLYSLDFNPLSDISFPNIFSYSVGLFILLIVYFTVPKPFSLMEYRLFIFASVSLEDISKNIAKIHVKDTLPMFSSRSFMVSGLMFKYLIHFQFIFVHDVRK